MRLLALILCLPVMVFATQKYCTPTGAGSHNGSAGNEWTIAEALDNVVAGDTVNLATGTVYVDSLWLTTSGTSANMIMWRAADAGVCSLRQIGPVLYFDKDVKYNHVKDIRFRTTSDRCMLIDSAHFNIVEKCRLWGGSNDAGNGSYEPNYIRSGSYNRILQCYINPLSPDGTVTVGDENDGLTIGDGWPKDAPYIGGKYNVVEACTVTAVTHVGISLSYQADNTGNIIRNNLAYYNHTGIATAKGAQYNLIEGNIVYWPDRMLVDQGGHALQVSSARSQIRFNKMYHDTVDYGASTTNPRDEVIDFEGLAEAGHNVTNNRTYRNTWCGIGDDEGTENLVLVIDNGSGADTNYFVSNIFYKPDDRYHFYIQPSSDSASWSDRFENNIFWQNSDVKKDTVVNTYFTGDFQKTLTLAETNFPAWTGNSFVSPLFTDSTSEGPYRSFAFGTNSPAYNTAIAPATVVFSTIDSKDTVTVTDALWYHYNIGGASFERGDSIWFKSGSTNTKAEIDSIDYNNNRLVLTGNVTVAAGDSVHIWATYSEVNGYVARISTYPDIGAYEYTSGRRFLGRFRK